MGQKCGCGKKEQSEDDSIDMDASDHLKVHVQTIVFGA